MQWITTLLLRDITLDQFGIENYRTFAENAIGALLKFPAAFWEEIVCSNIFRNAEPQQCF